jgi:hypothetical protein
MPQQQSKRSKLTVGFGKREITPPLPFPLAGIAGGKERLAARVHDPLHARALAFHDGQKTALVVSTDLLLTTEALRKAVEQKLAAQGAAFDGLLLCATHTHSSTGGYWDAPSAARFLGAYRPDIFAGLVENIAAAARAALGDLQPATLRFGETPTTYLNYNRRHAQGPIDRTVGALRIERPGKNIRAAFFGAHPVVAAFRDLHAASADYPGAVARSIEDEGDEAIFLVGPVGGVNVLFPEGPLDLDAHLPLLARLMREAVDRALAAATPLRGGEVAFAAGEIDFHLATPRLFPDRLAWADALALPLRLWIRSFGRGGKLEGRRPRVPVVRVGDLVFAGFPADLGAGVGLAARERIAARGWRTAVAASHADDYLGYVHLPPDYQQFQTADREAMWTGIYENAMGFGGRLVGENMLAALERALADLQ